MSSRKIVRFLASAAVAVSLQLNAVVVTVSVNTDAAAVSGGSFTSTTNCDLRGAINYLNTLPASMAPHTIGFSTGAGNNTITLSTALPPLNFPLLTPPNGLSTASITVDGSNTLSGTGQQMIISGISAGVRPFYAYQGTVILQNMTVKGQAKGGNGGVGAGGGGAGLGGALFVDQANVTVNNVVFQTCNVTGGTGGAIAAANSGGGGGGGMAGSGGASGTSTNTGFAGAGGGGGGLHPGATGGAGGGATAAANGGSGGGGGAFGVGGVGPSVGAISGGGGGGGGYGGASTSAVTGAAGGAGTTAAGGAGLSGGSNSVSGIGFGGGGGAGGSTINGGSGGSGAGGNCTTSGLGGAGGGCAGGCASTCTNTSSGIGGNGGSGGGGGGAGNITGGPTAGTGGFGGGGGGGSGSTTGGGGGGGGGYLGGGGGCSSGASGGVGGSGNFGGGGGGATFSSAAGGAGPGGFGGGGGGAATSGNVAHAAGGSGFGGGSGGLNGNGTATLPAAAAVGVGGGIASSTAAMSAGGGGAALGAAVFVNAPAGGSFTFQSNSSTTGAGTLLTSTSGSTATSSGTVNSSGAGFVGATSGTTVQEIFAVSGQTLNFVAVNAADTVTLGASIADNTLASIPASTTYTPASATATGALVTINAPIGSGAGKVIFSGTNTYGGTMSSTTIAGGILNIAATPNADSSLGASSVPLIFSGTGTLQLGATLTGSTRPITLNSGVVGTIDTTSFSGTFGGLISGSGTLASTGGKLTLSNASNNYTGGTQIASGILSINSANLGTGVITFIGNGGTLQFGSTTSYAIPSIAINTGATGTFDPQGFTATISSSITGSGTTAIISTGGGGILQTGKAGVFSATSPVVISSGATLGLGGFSQSIGSITGSGGTISLGSGALTVGGDNTSPTAFAGSITGSGTVTKVGTGTITLSGSNLYTGLTTINAGKLKVTGSLASSVTVNNSGILNGTGTISGAVTVNSGGTITPGSSVGTMTVGSLALNSGSITNIELNGSQNSLLQVNGSASLSGTLNFTVDPGNYSAQSYTFINASSLSGSFGSVSFSPSIPSGLVAQVVYTATSAQLHLISSSAFSSTSSSGLTGTQAALANYLLQLSTLLAQEETFVATNLTGLLNIQGLEAIVADLANLQVGALAAALDSISPARNEASIFFAQNTAFEVGNISTTRLSEQRIISRLIANGKIEPKLAEAFATHQTSLTAMSGDAPVPNKPADFVTDNQLSRKPAGSSKNMASSPDDYSVWATGFGDFIWQNAIKQNSIPKVTATAAGGLVGFDYYVKNGSLTVSGGYIHTSINESGGAGSGTTQSGILSIYGSGYIRNGYVDAGILGGYNHFNNQRNVLIPAANSMFTTFSQTATSSHNAWQFMPHVGFGYDIMLDSCVFEPFFGADCVVLFDGSFTETGAAPLDMSMPSKTLALLRIELGLNGYQTWDFADDLVILKESASYVIQPPIHMNRTASIVIPSVTIPAGAPSTFAVPTYKTLQMFSPTFELFYKNKSSGVYASALYVGEFGSGYMSNDVQGTLGYMF